MGEEEENEVNELAGWKTRKIEKSKKGVRILRNMTLKV